METSTLTAETLLEWERMGLPISEEHKSTIRSSGLSDILSYQEDSRRTFGVELPKKVTDGRHHLWLYPEQVAESGEGTVSYWEKCHAIWGEKWKDREIRKSDWCPERGDLIDKEFRSFINSHIPRFDNLKPYEPFYVYIEQARRWIAEGTCMEDFVGNERREYVQQEFRRIGAAHYGNRLYGMDKYVYIKDEQSDGGIRDYKASTPQALALFCADRGHSIYLGKGRQAALTSTFVPAHLILPLFKQSAKIVLVTDDLEVKAKNIFDDKFKYTFQWMPEWMKPRGFGNFSSTKVVFDFDPGKTKAEKRRVTSGFEIATSHDPTALNGLTPTVFLLDEAQGIPTFEKIIGEMRPTMMSFTKGKLRNARQIIAWGTGSSSSKGKGSFEGAYTALIERWQRGEDTSGFVPLFFDCVCRPGMTEDALEKIRRDYISGKDREAKGISLDEAEAMYAAHYPRSPQDMFMSVGKTVVPIQMIRKSMEFIEANILGTQYAPKYGYFEPIFDESRKMPLGSFHHAFIRGARFVETPHDPEAPVQIFIPPAKGWVHRYYKGTDPIQSDGGTSKFATAIWDAVGVRKGGCHDTPEEHLHPNVAAVLNMRTNEVNATYTQSALLGMYYANHGEVSCKDLVEYNQGHLYIKDFMQAPFIQLEGALVRRMELPDIYRNGQQQQIYGLDMKGMRKSAAYRDLTSMLHGMAAEGRTIPFYEFWSQLKTIEVDTKSDDSVEWGTIDYRKFNDDIVFAVFFAWLCCRSYGNVPMLVNKDMPATIEKGRYVRGPQGLKWVVEQVPYEYATGLATAL